MKIALIGCGNMGSALARHLAKHYSLTLCNRGKEKGQKLAKEVGAAWAASPAEAVKGADFVVLAIKPKDLSFLSSQISLNKDQTLLSVLAGTSFSLLREKFPEPMIVRMMPNLAVTIGKGIVGFAEEEGSEGKQKHEIEKMFSSLGLLCFISENKMDAFAALAASSPAFVFVIMEAMMEAGVSLGFSFPESREIVTAVFEGCAQLLKELPNHPAELKLQITSPGGTTIAGIQALESGGVRSALFEALNATYQKHV